MKRKAKKISAHRHPAQSTTTQVPDTQPGPYYVSVRRSEKPDDWRLVSGPYPEHETALALVNQARQLCEDIDPRAVWYAFGTVRMKKEINTPGILQKVGYDLQLKRNDK